MIVFLAQVGPAGSRRTGSIWHIESATRERDLGWKAQGSKTCSLTAVSLLPSEELIILSTSYKATRMEVWEGKGKEGKSPGCSP